MPKKPKKTRNNATSPNVNTRILEEFRRITSDFKEKHGLDSSDVIDLIVKEKALEEKPSSLPLYIFDNGKISSFEAIVKYLRERFNLKFAEIASLLKRSTSAVSSTYYKAVKKMPEPFAVKKSAYFIPVKAISQKKLSVLEAIVSHLKEKYGLKFHKIASLLRRDDRTIWTVYSRARNKTKKWMK